MEEGSTQQDYRGKGRGSEHWLHCYMHSDSNNEAQKLQNVLEAGYCVQPSEESM